jgi:tetratricopeptide (TPR) repeat protein
MFLEHRVPADAPVMAPVYENFRRNLHDIVEAARGSGAPVLISTVGANLKDCAPFGSLHRPDLTATEKKDWEAKVKEGVALEEAGKPGAAVVRYLAAAMVDDRYAELQFRIGRAYWAMGKFEAARQYLGKARDLDVLRFRADGHMNEIIRSVAAGAGSGVELVDGESVFSGASPHGVTGRELFYEHVHMNSQGNYLLASALFPRIVSHLPAEVRQAAGGLETPSKAESDRLLAVTTFDRRRVAREVVGWLSQPPFTYQLNHAEQVRALQAEAELEVEDPGTASAAYQWAIAKAPRDHWLRVNYGGFLAQREPASAAAEFRAALELLPGDYLTREKLVDALLLTGRFSEAIDEVREVLRRMPYHAGAHLTLAYALTQLGQLEQSVAAYERGVELNPAFAVDAYNQIGVIRLHQERFALAAATFQKAIDLDTTRTRAAELQYNLSYARAKLTTGPGARD